MGFEDIVIKKTPGNSEGGKIEVFSETPVLKQEESNPEEMSNFEAEKAQSIAQDAESLEALRAQADQVFSGSENVRTGTSENDGNIDGLRINSGVVEGGSGKKQSAGFSKIKGMGSRAAAIGMATMAFSGVGGSKLEDVGSRDITLEGGVSNAIEFVPTSEQLENLKGQGETVRNQLLEHIGSQEYLDKLKKEFNGDESAALQSQKSRLENLRQVNFEFASSSEIKARFGADDPRGARVGAYYDPEKKMITLPFDTDRTNLINSVMHEFVHASMGKEREITQKAKDTLVSSYKDLEGKSIEINDYLRQPGERIARKQQMDMEMERLGIKNYGEQFTQEHYEKLKQAYEKGELSRNVKIFFETTKPEDFKRIFDEIAIDDLGGDDSAGQS